MHVIGGWSDWVASLQIIVANLQAVGIDANVKLEPDWGAWQPKRDEHEVRHAALEQRQQRRHAVRVLLLALRSVAEPRQPVSTRLRPATGSTISNAKGAALLKQFKGTLDPAKQKAIALPAAVDLPRRVPVHPAVHRPALVDVQHEVLRRLGHAGRTSTSTRSTQPSSRSSRSCFAVAPCRRPRSNNDGGSTGRSGSAGWLQPARRPRRQSSCGRRQAGDAPGTMCILVPRRLRSARVNGRRSSTCDSSLRRLASTSSHSGLRSRSTSCSRGSCRARRSTA